MATRRLLIILNMLLKRCVFLLRGSGIEFYIQVISSDLSRYCFRPILSGVAAFGKMGFSDFHS